MTLIPELRSELGATLERRTRRRRRWILGLTPVALVATGGIALAASGALSSKSVPARIGVAPADADTGVVVDGTDRLLPIEVEGWTLRLSRIGEAACLTPERVGGARRTPAGIFDCSPLDAGDRLFFNESRAALLDDACARDLTPASCGNPRQEPLLYGALGPEAASVTFGSKTVPVSGPEGVYLIAPPNANDPGGASRYPRAKAITAITFRDGRTCTREQFDAAACPLPGFHPRTITLPEQAAVGSPITATARQGRRFWNLRVRFNARRDADGVSAGYGVRIFPPTKSGRSAMGPVRGQVRAGDRPEVLFQHLNGGGEYRIVVTYNQATEPGQLPMGNLNAVTVGRERLTIP
ncbi:hypothetical protein [Solirubrobacter soli]|uniref:hypothetical protein n=1 Tax=Solirubrobacter soli TaxID=363832 RepID=UPI0004109DE4|nr:hypothetical protein [Solirubrobacter soli]